MKIYKTQEEIEADIVDGVLRIDGDVRFEVSFAIYADIVVLGNIDALGINARDINARDIKACDINALGIKAWNIDALNINARNISFYAVAFAYQSFRCKSIKGGRENARYFCLDEEVKIG